MNDPMLMQATARHRELMREAEQARLVARVRRARRTPRPGRAKAPGFRLTTAIARLRPTTGGRWQAQ
jgi:hypothetical protein